LIQEETLIKDLSSTSKSTSICYVRMKSFNSGKKTYFNSNLKKFSNPKGEGSLKSIENFFLTLSKSVLLLKIAGTCYQRLYNQNSY